MGWGWRPASRVRVGWGGVWRPSSRVRVGWGGGGGRRLG